jgi:hypothetical protein
MPPLVRVGRSFSGTVSLPVPTNLSQAAPLEAHFHLWPPDAERAAARATLLGEARAVAARLRLPALVLEGRPDRCAMGEPPLAVSAWNYAGGGAAELSLPLLPTGRAWCLTVRANGSAAATLSQNLAVAAGSSESPGVSVPAVTAGSGTRAAAGSTSTGTTGGTATVTTPGTTRAVPETSPAAALPVSSQAGSTLTASSGAVGGGLPGQISFVLQVS